MKRFFVDSKIAVGPLELSVEEAKHATRVLRIAAGEELWVMNGTGTAARARIQEASRERVSIAVLELLSPAKLSPFAVDLLVCQLKGPRMDLLVEKATEIGAGRILPVYSERSVAQSERKDRWERIATSALKQSGNFFLPEISDPAPLAQALAELPQADSCLKIYLAPNAELALAQAVLQWKATQTAGRVILAIGPEGGFTDEEEAALTASGFIRALLSPQILRGETAAFSALFLTRHLLDYPIGAAQ